MSISLSKGQKISLEKEAGKALTRVAMGLGWGMKTVHSAGFFGIGKGPKTISVARFATRGTICPVAAVPISRMKRSWSI